MFFARLFSYSLSMAVIGTSWDGGCLPSDPPKNCGFEKARTLGKIIMVRLHLQEVYHVTAC